MASSPSILIDPALGCALIEAQGEAALGALLLGAAQRTGAVEEVFAYCLPDGASPQVMASSSDLADADARVSLYTRRFHTFDPAARARDGVPVGAGFARAVGVGEIVQRDYRALCFERPRFADKLCFGWRLSAGWLTLSFYRRRAEGARQTRQLGALANLAFTAMARRSAPTVPLVQRLERRLARSCPELTARERQVCARTLAGSSAFEIAGDLGIGSASVLTYRQRAYRRMGVSQANALLERLLY